VCGEVDVATSAQLQGVLAAQIERTAGPIWVNLAEVTFMDASGLRALVDASDTLRAKGLRLELEDPSRSVRRLLAASSMSAYFGLTPEKEQHNQG